MNKAVRVNRRLKFKQEAVRFWSLGSGCGRQQHPDEQRSSANLETLIEGIVVHAAGQAFFD